MISEGDHVRIRAPKATGFDSYLCSYLRFGYQTENDLGEIRCCLSTNPRLDKGCWSLGKAGREEGSGQ